MPTKRRDYNRYGPGGDLFDATYRAYRAGVLTAADVRSVERSRVPDCAGCGEEKGGMMTLEKRRLCLTCWRKEIAKRMGAPR